MAENTFTTLNGLFKNAYADKVSNMYPDFVYLAREAKDVPADQQPGGNHYQPVVVKAPQGLTKAAAAAGAFALNSPISGTTVQANIAGSQYLLREAFDYEVIMRSANSKNAFERATSHVIKNMMKVEYNMIESDMIWGQSGVGIVSAVGGAGNTVATITTASYAYGFWWGSEGRQVTFFSAAGVRRGAPTITDYSLTARTVTFDIDLTTIGVVATDIMYLGNIAATTDEMIGLYTIGTNTTGNLFGINSSIYNLWRPGAAYGCGSTPLSFTHVMKSMEEAAARGLGDEITTSDLIVNPKAWINLNTDAASIRRSDASYKGSKYENGHEVLEFYSVYGTIRIVNHKMMKEGFAIMLPQANRSLKKIGACPTPKFGLPGMVEGEQTYLRPMENNAGVETRLYANLALFTEYVSQIKIISGIVNA